MKKQFHSWLSRKVGASPVSQPFLKSFLAHEGYGREEIKIIMRKYFSPTINHYVLKKFDDHE